MCHVILCSTSKLRTWLPVAVARTRSPAAASGHSNNTVRYRGRHSARKVTPYPWECNALPSKYFKTRSLSRRLCIELLNETWKMMSATQRLRRRLLISFLSNRNSTGEKGRRIWRTKAVWCDSVFSWGLWTAGGYLASLACGPSHSFVVT